MYNYDVLSVLCDSPVKQWLSTCIQDVVQLDLCMCTYLATSYKPSSMYKYTNPNLLLNE